MTSRPWGAWVIAKCQEVPSTDSGEATELFNATLTRQRAPSPGPGGQNRDPGWIGVQDTGPTGGRGWELSVRGTKAPGHERTPEDASRAHSEFTRGSPGAQDTGEGEHLLKQLGPGPQQSPEVGADASVGEEDGS